MGDLIASADHFSFSYDNGKTYALKDLSFSLNRGESLGIIGPPKSGKTTLCLALSGVLRTFFSFGQWSGRVLISDIEVNEANLDRVISKTGILLEYPEIQITGIKPTVFEEVAFTLQQMGLDKLEIRIRVKHVLRSLGIEHLTSRSPIQLSGGEAKRLALATALVKDPELVVLDQPYSQLDLEGAGQLKKILRNLNLKEKSLIITECEAEHLLGVDNVMIIRDGASVAHGVPAEVLADPGLARNGVGLPTWVELAHKAALRAEYPTNRLKASYRSCRRFLKEIREHVVAQTK